MAMSTLLALLALAASLYLLFQSRPRLFPIVAVSAAGLEVLAAFGVFHPRLGGISLELVCGIALVVAGVMVHMKHSAKMMVSAATAVALVGAIQTLSALHVR